MRILLCTLACLCLIACDDDDSPVNAADAPTIRSFDPIFGNEGDEITISGTGFEETPTDNTVSFNGAMATPSSATSSQLTVALPASASSGELSVTTPKGKATADLAFTVTETDEDTWMAIDADAPNFGTLLAVCWSGSRFVAVGGAQKVYVSEDGIDWNGQEIDKTVGLFDVIWGDDEFVAVGAFGFIFTSPDGMMWTEQDSGTDDTFYAVAWSGSVYVATGDDFGSPATFFTRSSIDGQNWDEVSAEIGGASICWSGQEFVMVGGPGLFRSVDGTNWTKQMDPVGGLNQVIWTGSQFIAAGDGIWGSVDGQSWVEMETTGTSFPDDVSGIDWMGDHYLAFSQSDVLLSPDGRHWNHVTHIVTPFPPLLTSVAHSDDRVVITGWEGYVYSSPF